MKSVPCVRMCILVTEIHLVQRWEWNFQCRIIRHTEMLQRWGQVIRFGQCRHGDIAEYRFQGVWRVQDGAQDVLQETQEIFDWLCHQSYNQINTPWYNNMTFEETRMRLLVSVCYTPLSTLFRSRRFIIQSFVAFQLQTTKQASFHHTLSQLTFSFCTMT